MITAVGFLQVKIIKCFFISMNKNRIFQNIGNYCTPVLRIRIQIVDWIRIRNTDLDPANEYQLFWGLQKELNSANSTKCEQGPVPVLVFFK